MKASEAIRRYRKREKMTQAELAQQLGVSRITVNKIERGRGDISALMAVRLERVFKVTARWWLDRQNDVDLARARSVLP